jgi:hypothetical protein
MASKIVCRQKKKKYYLVEFANSIGKTTAELNLWDMIKFCKRSYLNEKKSS